MGKYVDGFVLPVPKKKVDAYRKMAQKAGKIWREHGALDYYECVGDDLQVKVGLPFSKLTKVKSTETVVFSFIIYKSKADRNRVNAKVMKDPRMNEMMPDMKKMPFDINKMTYGGFNVLVKA